MCEEQVTDSTPTLPMQIPSQVTAALLKHLDVLYTIHTESPMRSTIDFQECKGDAPTFQRICETVYRGTVLLVI